MIIEGLEQRLALILFYLGKEPTSIDQIAKYWSMLEFGMEFDGKYQRNKEVIKG
jgi:hypothetical protein